ncbi:MAG: TIGR04551 family protein [Deltaproteobacteria bacterium]|nr:TIGR04551 family protein [Deltaproteobacteria bacterium]
MKYSICAVVLLSLVFINHAQAQMGMGPQMGKGGPKDEKEMVLKKADDAEKNANQNTDNDDYLQKPPSFQMFSIDGYMRLRSDYFYRLDLGLHNHTNIGSPFPNPLIAYESECSGTNPPKHCRSHTIGSTNMRFRINPTIRPTSTISIHSTIDVFDNYVLGSSPSGQTYSYGTSPYIAYGGITGTQNVTEVGTTSTWDVIRFKNLYGKVNLKLFDLVFGRTPDHFGLGMIHNDGSGIDADYGDSVDRVGITTEIPSWKLKIGASWDFASQGLTSQIIYPWQLEGQPYDLGDFDDATQWTFFILRKYSKDERKTMLGAGKSVVDMGMRVTLRQQKYALGNVLSGDDNLTYTSNDMTQLADLLKPRESFLAIPDVWFEFRKGNLTLQMELAGKYGWISNLSDVTLDNGTTMARTGDDLKFLSLGGVFRVNYKWSTDFNFCFEAGYASGDDQYENIAKKGTTNFQYLSPFPVDGKDSTNTLFLFHPSYHVGMIFFRELMGTVYNSTYAKLDMVYKANRWRFKATLLLPFANEKVATPGNDFMYGAEVNADVSYTSEDGKFIIGLGYGFFYPLDAMERPSSIYDAYAADANTAHTFQGRIILKY